MTLDGHIGTISIHKITIITNDHQPLVKVGEIEAGQGVLEPGTILARNASLKLAAWDGGGDPVGVLEARCDTDKVTAVTYLAHGTVVEAALIKSGGGAPDKSEIFALAKAGIHGV